jgi:hypothetical protein
MYQVISPVLFVIFNRPDTAKHVFAEIKKQKPKYLFIASDGPRNDKPGEAATVNDLRNSLINQIDWDCELKTLFRKENIGCGLGVSTAITWFFDNVEQGIILEDDCVPLPGFFEFCDEMLNYYKDNDRIYEISGTNLQGGNIRSNGSYYFSKYGGIWGWATWARAWRHFSYEMENYDQFVKEKRIEKIFTDKKQQKYWIETLNKASKLGSWWDYQWVYSFWSHNGICIVPNVNLIKNIGFDNEGTHTLGEPNGYTKLAKGGSLIEIRHPQDLKVNIKADSFLFKQFINPPLMKRIYWRLKKILLTR